MRELTVAEIIRLWETAHRQHPVDRALAMLQVVLPERSRDELAALTLGQRDALLLALRRATFGDRLPGTSDCPDCGQTVEFELSCSALQIEAAAPAEACLQQDGYRITVRPLDSFDLAAAAAADTVAEARATLLGRCASDPRFRDRPIALASLPEAIQERIAECALAADTRAERLLDLGCPNCHLSWQSALDIGQVLWLEISARALRLLLEVHTLASAYGWGETAILGLTPERRAAYLQMASA